MPIRRPAGVPRDVPRTACLTLDMIVAGTISLRLSQAYGSSLGLQWRRQPGLGAGMKYGLSPQVYASETRNDMVPAAPPAWRRTGALT